MDEKELKKLVLMRLEMMPSNLNINMGEEGILNKEKLISHVKKDDSLGKKIIEMQLKYMQAMKSF
jgi:hypothetical protein